MTVGNLPDRAFYTRDARIVAQALLGLVLVTHIGGVRTSGMITETEAYLGTGDMASHSYPGITQRNRVMFGEGGHVYVYLIYGMYYCVNVVTGADGTGEAVLIRGVEPLEGIATMEMRRGKVFKRKGELTDGPGKLTIAMGIGPELNGTDLLSSNDVWIEYGKLPEDMEIQATPRIGITKDTDHEWRWVAKRRA